MPAPFLAHPKLTKISQKQLFKEVVVSRNTITQAIGRSPVCLRPPYGMSNDRWKNYP